MRLKVFLLLFSLQLAQKLVFTTSLVDLQLSTDDVKTFSTPGYPLVPYSNDASYEWRIQAPHDRRILITFIAGRTEGCCDRVQVIEGSETIGEFSGIIIPGTSRLSQSNSLRVIFSSDDSVSFAGFQAEFKTATCGRNIEVVDDNALELTSDGWPNAYGNNEKCFWVLYGRERKQIQLDLIEGSTEPDNDHIEVFDGLSSIAKRNGNITTESLIAKSGILILSFQSDDQKVERGFRATYKEAKCGFTATATDNVMTLSTPFHPSLYSDNVFCEWTLRAAVDKLIEITFVEGETEDCCDFVQIIDDTGQIGQLSGKIPAGLAFTSTNNNYLRLRFSSDSRGSGPGFRAVFREIDPTSSCVYSEFVGETPKNISSPLYPHVYHNNMSCQWNLQANDQHIIRITFLDARTQACCDIIKVIENGEEVFALSAGGLRTWTSTTDSVTITFNSDSSIVDKGFLATIEAEEPVCRFAVDVIVNSTTGYFTSPQYPGIYPDGVTCVWNLMASPGRSIVITFLDVSVEENDFIQVLEGENETTKISGKNIQRRSVTSINNKLKIVFKTDRSGTSEGFRASYHDVLRIYPDTITNISSPGYPLVPYSNDASYEWRIQAPDDLRILITFIAGRTEGCCDRVRVNDESKTIGEFSGIIIPGTSRLSQGNSLRVTFFSDDTISFSGFEAKLQTATCGRNIQVSNKHSLQLTSDGWPNAYANNQKCFWIFYGRERKQIQLDLIEESTTAVNDYIEIFDGLSSIARLSGDITTESFLAETGILILSFLSDDKEVGRGFRATYKEAKCGFNATASDTPTILSTPFYPSLYPDDLSCEWNMNAAADKLIELTFMETDTEDCCDFIQIIDGSGEHKQLSGKIPSGLVFTSIDNNLRLLFNSDSRGSGPGFRAVFREIDPSSNCVYTEFVDETPKNISSPLYPYIYHNNMSCQWILQANSQSIIKLRFLVLKVQACCDVIKVMEDGKEVLTLSEDQTLSWESTGNLVTLTFSSDSSIVGRGFLASVQSELQVCQSPVNIAVNSTTSNLTSPLYPMFYPNDITCVWNLKAATGRRVVIAFIRVKLQENDYVQVLDEAKNVLNMSRPIMSGTIRRSTNNKLQILFKTDQSGRSNGFLATFHDEIQICQSPVNIAVNSTTGYFASPLYPMFYPKDVTCVWNLMASSGQRVVISFMEGTIQENDYIQVLDGENEILKISERIVAKTTRTSTNSNLRVIFKTGQSGSSGGFKASYYAEEHVCQSSMDITVNSTTGYLSSPLYPRFYPNAVTCFWKLTSTPGRRIVYTLIEGSIEENDSVLVYEGRRRLLRFSGQIIPVTSRISSSNSVEIFFKKSRFGSTSSFRASYHDANCGDNVEVTDEEKMLTPPRIVMLYLTTIFYQNNLNCFWILYAKGKNQVRFELSGGYIISDDYVKIFDGNTLLTTKSRRIHSEVFRSTKTFFKIHFYSNNNFFGIAFTARYRIERNG
ncbi:cubilin-like isoform X2 [Clavelina lepadiformis]|uniref:cubilin-like isoform X2 n=1 Tax=Clavelina lepadiformis TaxID=159417 RepID=UPI004041130B